MPDWMSRLLREPLLHFFVAGALLYGIFAWRGGMAPTDASNVITVNRDALLRFMQFRAKAFDADRASASFDALSAEQRQQLVDEYVREEVLYREARALGLDRGDDVLRQRLVQKMQYVLDEGDVAAPTEQELQRYFAKNLALYRIEESYTFTHVFLDPAVRGENKLKAEARSALAVLQKVKAGFNDAPGYGDRFPYLQNYVERTGEYVGSHFGPSFVSQLAQLRPDDKHWQGPWKSDHGLHLVLLVAKQSASDARFEEVKQQLVEDYRRDAVANRREQALRELTQGYAVRMESVLPVDTPTAASKVP
jgi:PPIC-type PPIASE domain